MPSSQPSSRGRQILLWSFGIIACLSLAIGLTVARMFGLDRTDSRIRDEFFRSVHAPVHCEVQINLGPALLTPARFLVGFIDEIPPEARLALSAARRASIGVYSIDGNFDANALFDAATNQRNAEGWNLVAAVRDGDETFMIYLPRQWSPDEDVSICVAVCDGNELVLVSARLRPGPLIEIAARNLPDFLQES